MGKNIEGIEKLRSLPYLSLSKETISDKTSNALIYDPDTTFQGYNIYCSRSSHEARLIDMPGKTVHRWFYDQKDFNLWDNALLYENGNLLVINKFKNLLLIDRNSSLI